MTPNARFNFKVCFAEGTLDQESMWIYLALQTTVTVSTVYR